MANDLGFLKVWAKANQSIRPTSGNLSDFLNEYKSEPSKKDGSDDAYIDNKTYEVEKPDMPEITTEEQEVMNKYGFEPETFSYDDFKTWAENHNFEYRLTGGLISEYKWLPKHANKWNPFKFLTTKEDETDKEVLERYLEKKTVQTNAKNHPILTSTATVVTAPYRGLAGTVATGKDAVLSAFGKEINTNDEAHNIVEDANLIRETVTDEHASKWFGGANGKLGNYGALIYNAAMSIGDTVMISLTTKGLGSGLGLSGKTLTKFVANTTSTLLASNSASSTIMQKKKEGVSDRKAVAVGVATGLAEFITEKYSLEAIFKTPSSVIKKGLISFAAEGSEEGFSDILSKTADYLILGDDSTIRKNITRYMQNGMSRKDATKQATVDSLWETASASLVGGFTGIAMGSAYHGFSVPEIKKVGSAYRTVATDVIQSGLESPKDSIAYKHAKKLSEKGIDNISNYELGLQHTYNVEQIEYEQEQKQKQEQKRIKQELKDGKISYPSAESVSSANIGDTFIEQGSNKIIRIVDRNNTHATVEITTPSGVKETKLLRVAAVDNMAADDKYTKVETSVDTPTTTEAPPVSENATVESNVVEETEQTPVVEVSPTTEQVAVSENTTTSPTPKPIHLTRVGNNYDIYGEDAVVFADALGIETKKEMINGVETDVIRLPADIAETFADAISEEYNLIMSDKVTAETNTDTESRVETPARTVVSTPKNITLNKIGNSYEVYGNDAVELANNLNLVIDKKMVNGVETDVLYLTENLVNNISKDHSDKYNFVTTTEAKNQPVTSKTVSSDKDANNNETKVTEVKNSANVLQNQSESATMEEKIENTSVESEENSNEQGRANLLYADGKRNNNGGARKQTERILSFRRRNQGKNATERANFARGLIQRGLVEEISTENAKYNLVKPEAYNDDMLAMVEDAKRRGVELRFFVGRMEVEVELDDGTKVTKLMSGLALPSSQVAYVQYDDTVESPQQIYKHELCHTKWYSPEMQKIKNTILNSLTEAEKQKIKQTQRFKDYMTAYKKHKNKEAICWEEFVCDVMSGMSDYTANFIDTAYDYWYENEEVDSYNPADYTTSTDAGGRYNLSGISGYPEWTEDVLDDFEFGKLETALLDIESGTNANYYNRSASGEYIIQTDNKLIYTDGNYSKPEISKIIEFNSEYETEIDEMRRLIYEAEKGKSELEMAYRIIEGAFGQGSVITHDRHSNTANGKSTGLRKGNVSKGNSPNGGTKKQRRSRYVEEIRGASKQGLKAIQKVREKWEKSGVRYSITDVDSNGNTLTKEQQDFFKDSKVTDESGNLLVMYQGSTNDFTVFDRKKSSYANLYGRGFYFTKSENHASQYGNTRAYYLNIKHPVSTTETTITKSQLRKFLQAVAENEDYSFENYGYDATVDSVLQSTYGKSDFLMLNDVSQTAIGDLVEAVELFNEVNGTDYDGIVLDTETVTFNSEQAKLTSNKTPTSNPDVRFNLTQPVEETKNLIAVHNLSPAKLLKTLKLGGLPMPSIAITRAKDGWNNFGDISLVFDKYTIDPQFMKRNKVYSGDAWTPTYPRIEYKVNENAQEQIRKKIDGLVPISIQDDLGGLHLDSSNIEYDLNRDGDMVTSYRYNYAMKYAFLRDYDVNIELPTKEESFVRYGTISNDAVISFAHKMVNGLKTVNSLWEQHSSKLMADTELINTIADILNNEVLETADKNTEAYQELVENPLFKAEDIDFSTVLNMLEGAREYFNANGKAKKKIDYRGAREKIDDYFNSHSLEKDYEYWLKNLFSDIVGKEGIRNNKDLFTPSGNRRSFEALHYEHNLENVIKAMYEQGDKGVGAFGGGNILGAATKEYGSIADIKADAQNRMEQIPESQYDEIKKGFTDRLFELASSLVIHKDSFSAIDSAANMLIEAVSKYKSKSGMANYLRKESQGWANYNDSVVDDLIELVNDIRQAPVSYFEAKPQRAVGFDEIKAVIMPEQASYEDDLSKVKGELEKIGVPILEYEYGDNNSRLKALNSLEDMRFSLANDNSYAPTFYSYMGKTIDEMKQDKIGANSVVSYLKGRGVKDEEIKWSGIETFLDGKKSVTKAELQDFVAGNQLQIEETVMDGSQSTTLERQEDGSNDYYVMRGGEIYDSLTWDSSAHTWVSDAYGFYFDSMPRIRNYYGVNESGTRWGKYKLKGGENYREIIFKMPDSTYKNDAMRGHWGEDAEGVLAHARVQDFDVDGGKMLFIEEIQSDWHNEGHKKGYRSVIKTLESQKATEEYYDALRKFQEARTAHQNDYHNTKLREEYEQWEQKIIELADKRADASLEAMKGVEDAPYRDNYHEYVLKRLLRMASEQGYDSIGWTPADVQSKRWSDEYAEGYRIEYDQDIPKFLNKYGKKWGAKVGKTSLSGTGSYTDYYEFEGAPTEYYTIDDAEQGIVDRYNQINPEQQVSKVDTMFIAGQFVVYDRVAGIELGRFDRVNAPTKVWTMPITDSMRDSVLYEGQARYNISAEQETEYLELAKEPEKNEKRLSEMVDEMAKANGYNIKAYHGTARADRVGTVFRPDRATSGPMAYFTDSKEIASNYARDKSDTSLAYDEEYDSYYTQFRVNRGGKSISIPDLWKYLSISQKNKIKEIAGHIKFDDDYENIIVDKSAEHGNGAYDAYTLNMHRGNVLEALVDTWLEMGDLYNREADFLEVLKLVGIEDAEYKDPDARQEKVYDTWLKIQKPFDTDFADKNFYDSLSNWIETHDMSVYEKETSNADMWDKNNQTPETWLEKLDNDIGNGTTHAWTVIPDFVTDYLKEQHFDGIKDKGGKGGGDGHTVWIPFSSKQIKSSEPVTYDDGGNIIPLSERFNENNDDIRWNLSGEDADIKTQKQIESIAQEISSHEELIATAKKNTQEFIGKIKENKSLQKRLHNAKRQMLLSPTPIVNATKAGNVTKEILKEMNSTLKASDLRDEVMSIYNEYFASIKKAGGVESKIQTANENMMMRFAELAVDIADSSEVFIESDDYMMLKSYLKNTRIKVPDWAKSDVHYAEFRKSHMGTFNLTNDGLDIDVAYAELCELFPGIFDSELLNPANQLLEIANTLEKLKPYAYNPNTGFMQEAIDHIVYRFVSEADGLAAAPKTKAQKIAEKGAYDKEVALEKERAAFERKLEKQKKDSEKLIRIMQKKIDDAKYVRYWENRLDKEEKAQAIKELRERRDVAVLKSRIRNIVSDMKKNLDKSEKAGGYPKELVKVTAEICSVLDFHTGKTNKDGTPTKVSLKLDALKMQYDALKNNENYDFKSEHSEELSGKIEELHNLIKDKRVTELNVYELSQLKDILSEISHRLSNASKQIGLEKARENAIIGTEIINSLNSKNDVIEFSKKQILREMKLLGQKGKAFVLNPHRINEMIAGYDKNSAWWNLYDAINRGSRKASKFVMEANKPFDELIDGGGNEIAFYDFRTKNIKTGIKYIDGSEVEIPKSIICELVMAWERKQGRTHLEADGAKIPDMKLYNKGKTTTAITDGGRRTMPITPMDIARLKQMLDSYDLEWMDKARHLFNKTTKDAINETSMELLGRELAKSENYIRLYVDKDFIRREIDGNQYDSTLESHGSLKETTPNAKQPIILRGLHENVYDQIDFAAKYYGLAIPIRNFNKVYNTVINNDGERHSVRETIGKKFGSNIQLNVIEQLIKDLQSPRKSIIEPFGKIRGNWLGATFWGNIRSTLKQTTSYWTASAIIGEDSLAKGLVQYARNSKQTKAEINKYSGTLYKRSQGLSTTELGDRANAKRLAGASNKVTKVINQYAPALRNIPMAIRPANWLQSMDCSVASALWEACKIEASKTMNASDDGYMKVVTDLYERVIEETQSNYDVTHRPEALKNTNTIVRTITMFQTDNLQQTGIIYSAFNDYKTKADAYKADASSDNKRAIDEAKDRLSKAIRSRVYSSLWLVFATMLGDMLLRKFKPYVDDEEKDITSRSILKQLMQNMCDDMFGVFVPVAGQLITSAMDTWSKGYDFVTEPSFEAIQEFIEATSKIWDSASEGRWEDTKEAVSDAIPAISNFTGIPLKNITELFNSAKGYAGDIKDFDFAHDITNYASSKSFYSYDDLASCIISGDAEKEKKITDYYSASDKEVEKSAITKAIKPAYVQMYIDSPEKAYNVKRKLILDYDYTEDSIDEWAIKEYLRHIVPNKKYSDGVVSNPEYAAEIKTAVEKKVAWSSKSVQKTVKSHYKQIYKDGNEKDTKSLRDALLKDGGFFEVTISTWEREADNEIKKEQNKANIEKKKFK